MILEMIQGVFAGVSAIALLIFAGITLSCSGLVFLISTPLFIICSPVLVPATIATTLLATGFTASGSFLTTAISIISWIIKKRTGQDMPKIPGLSPGIIAAKKEDKKKKKQKGKKDQKNMKKAKNDMQETQKIDKKKDKKKEKKKDK